MKLSAHGKGPGTGLPIIMASRTLGLDNGPPYWYEITGAAARAGLHVVAGQGHKIQFPMEHHGMRPLQLP